MAELTVQDANGKSFSFDMAKVCDINGDVNKENPSSIQDSKRSRMITTHDVQYVDASGKALDSLKLLTDMKSGAINVVALDVDIEATHSGKNHNYCVYYEDSMEKDAESFMNPFHKPMLKNHDSWSEPLGRIKQSTFGPSQLTDERSAINLKVRVTDQDAIPKFVDGRYGTVSIGGSMGTVTCNICGKTILKDGKFSFCGHWKGETYKDEVCYWGAKDIEYHEVSTVNNPADDFAQVMKVTVLTDEDLKKENNDNKEGADNMNGQNTNQTDSNQNANRDQLINLIDKLLGTPATAATSTTDGANETPATPPASTTDGANQTNEKTVEDMQKELDEANKKVADMQKELDAEKQKVTDAVAAKELAETDASTFKDQCVALALANKSLIADKIVELEITHNKLEDSKTEERKQELVALSMKDLNSALEVAAKDTTQQRQPAAQVANPTVANGGEKNSTIVDKDGNPVSEDSKKEKDVQDSNKKTSIEDVTKNILDKLKR